MASLTGVRTLFPTIFPPGVGHVHAVHSAGPFESADVLFGQAAVFASLLSDFFVKAGGASKISFGLLENLARFDLEAPTATGMVRRSARLMSMTMAYVPLWNDVMDTAWTPESPARIAADRRHLQVELDALSALSLGLTADELCVIYRTQFPVLRGYEQTDLYDANGRRVPGDMNRHYRRVGEANMRLSDRQWTHPQSGVEYTFELPFRGFDREEDMRAAYAKFSTMLEVHGEILEEA